MPANFRSLITRMRGPRWVILVAGAAGIALAAYVGLPSRQTPQTYHITSVQLPAASAAASAAPTPPRRATQSAAFGADAIDIIVKSNDTLDGIFRRLKLDLSDLAFLRSLPGL